MRSKAVLAKRTLLYCSMLDSSLALMQYILAEWQWILAFLVKMAAYLLASVHLDMSAASAPFHLILSPNSIAGKNSDQSPFPAPALEDSLR